MTNDNKKPDNKAKGNSSCLKLLYGQDYEQKLGESCISFTKDCQRRNLYLGLSCLMLIINITMSISLFPLNRLLVMFTNWAQMITELSLILVIYYGQKRDINSCKGTLAFIHIILEFALAFNIVVVIVYWSMLHVKILEMKEEY